MLERIKAIIKELNLSQNKFAEKIGMSSAAMSAILNGKRNLADGTIARIVARTGVNEKWLRTGEGEMFEKSKPTEQTPEEFAKSHGCDDFAAGIFARYCRFSDEDKRRFSELLQRLVNNPESVVGKIGGSSVAINNVFGDNNTHIN